MVVASERSNKKGATNNILRLKDKNEKESGTIVETLHMMTEPLYSSARILRNQGTRFSTESSSYPGQFALSGQIPKIPLLLPSKIAEDDWERGRG